MRRRASAPSFRSLEWRIATAWIAMVFAILFPPGISARGPFLDRYPMAFHVADFGAAVIVLILVALPLLRGTTALRCTAVLPAIFSCWRLAGWMILLTRNPGSVSFPLQG